MKKNLRLALIDRMIEIYDVSVKTLIEDYIYNITLIRQKCHIIVVLLAQCT